MTIETKGAIGIVLGVGVIAVLVLSSLDSEQTTTTMPTEPKTQTRHIESVTVANLHSAFAENEVRANQRYKDQWLEVSGYVDSVSQFGDEGLLHLVSTPERTLSQVTCYFARPQRIARLQPGETVTVVGQCSGETLTIIALKHCRLVS